MAGETIITTDKITLPKEVAKGIITKARDESVLQALSPSSPQMFKDVEHILFSREPEAEFVGEGVAKSPTDGAFTPVPAEIHKAQVTIRMSEEVKWADEDNQLEIVNSLIEAGGAALARALDYGGIHGLNPLTGTAVTGMGNIVYGATPVEATANPSADLDTLIESVNESYDVTGIALSKAYANSLRKLRVPNTMARLYPEIPINLKLGSLDGVPAACSGTVNGALAATATGVMAVLGDFSKFKWGIVRDLGMEVIETGDPDGLGDLKRYNQIAYRMEMVYAWAILAADAFAVLKAAEESEEEAGGGESNGGGDSNGGGESNGGGVTG